METKAKTMMKSKAIGNLKAKMNLKAIRMTKMNFTKAAPNGTSSAKSPPW
jgi:hypothetical protein